MPKEMGSAEGVGTPQDSCSVLPTSVTPPSAKNHLGPRLWLGRHVTPRNENNATLQGALPQPDAALLAQVMNGKPRVA